eukprot:CAMPEP_0179898612 /NCGR_PEP_ID=MMETSP0982-20121206/37768_1 /TAXON_ID=483367 /ORGANISM="non described non described, Strain CCMP 2436" /LENGTH=156 /DNA_ID=CAMNT_0021795993 /DNA_START=74 /DNA_END=545 /DNA_ORIENTATION=-
MSSAKKRQRGEEFAATLRAAELSLDVDEFLGPMERTSSSRQNHDLCEAESPTPVTVVGSRRATNDLASLEKRSTAAERAAVRRAAVDSIIEEVELGVGREVCGAEVTPAQPSWAHAWSSGDNLTERVDGVDEWHKRDGRGGVIDPSQPEPSPSVQS